MRRLGAGLPRKRGLMNASAYCRAVSPACYRSLSLSLSLSFSLSLSLPLFLSLSISLSLSLFLSLSLSLPPSSLPPNPTLSHAQPCRCRGAHNIHATKIYYTTSSCRNVYQTFITALAACITRTRHKI